MKRGHRAVPASTELPCKADINLLIRSVTMTGEGQGAVSTYDPGDDASLKGETGHL